MKVEKFDQSLINALRTLGFDIEKDAEAASLGSVSKDEDIVINGARVEIIQPAGSDKLLLVITAPNGTSFTCNVKGKQIIRDVFEDEDEDEDTEAA